MEMMCRTFSVNGKEVTDNVPVMDGLEMSRFVELAYPDGMSEKVRVWWWHSDNNGTIAEGSRFFPANGCRIEVTPNSKL